MITVNKFLISKGLNPDDLQINGMSFKDIEELLNDYRLEVFENVKFSFDICSDHSTMCLGYRNLCDRIEREKSHEPLNKNISPVKSITEEMLFHKIQEDNIEENYADQCLYFDSAQGRDKCTHPKRLFSRCKGICEKFEK